jgi:5-oxopent-3-ene-1,2,5-tricarboxylate decarboxylase / 2-hydroxyhepta-2,4-diene-1,7-dioate isomerase
MLPTLNVPPWRLSGTVIGTLLNDPASLAALGDAVNALPYKAPPKAPVLYVKPRNTMMGAPSLPEGVEALEVGASLGIVIGRTARKVAAAQALEHVAGWTLVVDLCVPHTDVYRPSVRLRALDGSCLMGPIVVPCATIADPDAIDLQVQVGGRVAQSLNTSGMRRSVATLIQDVSECLSLHPGDVLMLGVRHAAPQVKAGESFSVSCEGIGTLQGMLAAAGAQA